VLERTLVSSFLPAAIREAARSAPQVARGVLTETWDTAVLDLADEVGAGAVCLHHPLATEANLAELARRGLDAVLWTVDDPARIAGLLRAGVRVVITNRPDVGVRARKEAGL
jgi:glycerophosphoryl diester phosphodiesterase